MHNPGHEKSPGFADSYFPQIDVIKGLAIIAVVILHTVSSEVLKQFHAQFYIWQAVPIFLIISGITLPASYGKRGFNKFTEFYSKEHFIKRCERLLVPLIIVFLISTAAGLYSRGGYFGWLNLSGYLPVTGPGNYYITILLQFLILSPLIAYFYYKLKGISIILLIVLNLIFEFAAPYIGFFNDYPYLYNGCIFRYLSAIAFGLYVSYELYTGKHINIFEKRKIPVLIGICISIGYLIAVSFFNWQFPLFRPVSAVVIFAWPYALLLVIGLLNLDSRRFANSIFYKSIILSGKASYHIFLVQILFFGFGLSLTRFINTSSFIVEGLVSIIGNLVFTIILGLLFYYIEGKVTSQVFKRTIKQT